MELTEEVLAEFPPLFRVVLVTNLLMEETREIESTRLNPYLYTGLLHAQLLTPH
jgi:hypothetical protein